MIVNVYSKVYVIQIPVFIKNKNIINKILPILKKRINFYINNKNEKLINLLYSKKTSSN